jgi:hypothetical protein
MREYKKADFSRRPRMYRNLFWRKSVLVTCIGVETQLRLAWSVRLVQRPIFCLDVACACLSVNVKGEGRRPVGLCARCDLFRAAARFGIALDQHWAGPCAAGRLLEIAGRSGRSRMYADKRRSHPSLREIGVG